MPAEFALAVICRADFQIGIVQRGAAAPTGVCRSEGPWTASTRFSSSARCYLAGEIDPMQPRHNPLSGAWEAKASSASGWRDPDPNGTAFCIPTPLCAGQLS